LRHAAARRRAEQMNSHPGNLLFPVTRRQSHSPKGIRLFFPSGPVSRSIEPGINRSIRSPDLYFEV
jgi:hypothetical protein